MISHLPAAAMDILERCRVADEERAVQARLRIDKKQQLKREEANALAARADLVAADQRNALVTEKHGIDDKGRKTVERERDTSRLKRADTQISMIRRKIANLDDIKSEPVKTAARIELDLEQFARKELVEVDRPELPLRKNERPVDALPRLRDETLSLISQIKTVQRAPRTLSEVKAVARRELAKLADAGLPKTLAMFTTPAGINWPVTSIPSSHAGMHSAPDGLALIAFLFRKELTAAVDELIKINAGAFPEALSAEDKATKLSALSEALDASECIEAGCVEAIIEEGGVASHRANASVLAVLSLRVAD
jgi:hypothetical protein